MAGERRLRMAILRFFGSSLAALLLIIFHPGAASQVWANGDLRPFKDDAGVFDPAEGPVKIGYQLLKDTDTVEVRVRDFRGQIVDNFSLIELLAGDHTVSWNGEDADE